MSERGRERVEPKKTKINKRNVANSHRDKTASFLVFFSLCFLAFYIETYGFGQSITFFCLLLAVLLFAVVILPLAQYKIFSKVLSLYICGCVFVVRHKCASYICLSLHLSFCNFSLPHRSRRPAYSLKIQSGLKTLKCMVVVMVVGR